MRCYYTFVNISLSHLLIFYLSLRRLSFFLIDLIGHQKYPYILKAERILEISDVRTRRIDLQKFQNCPVDFKLSWMIPDTVGYFNYLCRFLAGAYFSIEHDQQSDCIFAAFQPLCCLYKVYEIHICWTFCNWQFSYY